VYPRKGRRKEEETDGQRQKGKKGKEASARASERASEREREREREREKKCNAQFTRANANQLGRDL